MTVRRHHNWFHDWQHTIDYETLWLLSFSAAVIGSGIFALFSIAQNSPSPLP
ncbi:MAG TPA: hypothetical protein VIY51_16415 [Xanthobacteraceae bacterium]